MPSLIRIIILIAINLSILTEVMMEPVKKDHAQIQVQIHSEFINSGTFLNTIIKLLYKHFHPDQ